MAFSIQSITDAYAKADGEYRQANPDFDPWAPDPDRKAHNFVERRVTQILNEN